MSERTLREWKRALASRETRDWLRGEVDSKVRELRPWVPDFLLDGSDGKCEECRTEFDPSQAKQRFCSPLCQKRAAKRRANDKRYAKVKAERAASTHCRHGHPWEGNAFMDAGGRRLCRTCMNAGVLRWHESRGTKKAA